MRITMADFEKFETLFSEWAHHELEKIAYDYPRGCSKAISTMKRDLRAFKLGMAPWQHVCELPEELAKVYAQLT